MSQPLAPPVMQRWLRAIEHTGPPDPLGDPLGDLLADALDDQVVFYSPAVFSPQRGRDLTAAYLRAAARMFASTDFRYVEKWFGPRSAVLAFSATVDGLTVEGVDIIHWNDENRIVSVKVMIRPFKALQSVIGRMAELLAAP